MNENLIHNVLVDINEIRNQLELPSVTELKMGDKSCRDCPILNTITDGLSFLQKVRYTLQANGSLLLDGEHFIWKESFQNFVNLFDLKGEYSEYFQKGEYSINEIYK